MNTLSKTPRGDSAKTAWELNLKNLRITAVVAVAAAVLLTVFLTRDSAPVQKPKVIANSRCGSYRSDKTVKVGSAEINAEVAQNTVQLEKGLGGRPCIEPDRGMLFVFSRPSHYAFWMKDMKFPIDMVWIGADHKVAGLEVDVKPSTYPDHFVNKDKPAQYVLELKANRTKELGLNIGSTVNF